MYGAPLSTYGSNSLGLVVAPAVFGFGFFGLSSYGDLDFTAVCSKYGVADFGATYFGDISPCEVLQSDFFLGLGVSGRIGKVGDADPLGVNGIWQMRMTKRGKVPIKMKFYRPTNPQTVPQEANRTKFANAMSAWGSLSSEDKAVYNARAKKRNMFGWGLFIREYYKANP